MPGPLADQVDGCVWGRGPGLVSILGDSSDSLVQSGARAGPS